MIVREGAQRVSRAYNRVEILTFKGPRELAECGADEGDFNPGFQGVLPGEVDHPLVDVASPHGAAVPGEEDCVASRPASAIKDTFYTVVPEKLLEEGPFPRQPSFPVDPSFVTPGV